MKTLVKDIAAATAALTGGLIVFAKLQDYHWWLIGSWRGALAVITVLSVAILFTSLKEIVSFDSGPSMLEAAWWLITATLIIGALFSVTTKLEFLSSATAVGIGCALQLTRHLWRFERVQHTRPIVLG